MFHVLMHTPCRNATFMDRPAPIPEPAPPSLKEITLAKATEYGRRSHAAGHGCANDDAEFTAFLATTTATVRESMRHAATIDILDAYNKAWQAADRPYPEEVN